jgi:hypothetical protein
MVSRSDQVQTWADVQLPYVVRYRANAFARHFAAAGALLAAAAACFAFFESLLPAAFPALLGVSLFFYTVFTWWHVRRIDHLRIDEDALTLVAKDGAFVRIPYTPDLEFAVTYEQCCRSIVVMPADNHWDREHVVADLLDVPRGLTIHGLCDLMNDLTQSRVRGQSGRATVRRRQDWYRDPARISRLLFLVGSLALSALFLCVLFVLTAITWPFSEWVSKPILFVAKLALSLLFAYPAYRFLVVGRLRDLGEAATHGNAMGLMWNKAAGGPLRLFLRQGQQGRNQFGPEPRV